MNRVLLDQEKVIRNREPWKCNRTGNHFTLFLDFFFFFHFFCNIATARKRKQYFVMVYCFRTCFLSWWTMINWNLSGFVNMLHLNHLIASSVFDPSFTQVLLSWVLVSLDYHPQSWVATFTILMNRSKESAPIIEPWEIPCWSVSYIGSFLKMKKWKQFRPLKTCWHIVLPSASYRERSQTLRTSS